ncbi:MAG: aminopeptidase P family protein [Rhodobacteraceae bacterium]|nr:aminopeptidase P family protein [Paracoccaceae bacterium]
MTDFPRAEYEARLEAANRAMQANSLDAILLASEAEVRYFTGFRTQFWQSPTRPWFVILRRDQTPLAIIPEIGAELMARSDIAEIEAWPAPRPHDDGLSLLKDRLANCQRLGVLMGHETTFRMPLRDVFELHAALPAEWIDATDIIRDLRMVKSKREIAYIRQICGIASQGFARVPEIANAGQSLSSVFREFKRMLLELGADDVPYLVGGVDHPSYDDVISPPDDRPLSNGQILMLDTGATLNGYFCDFDRNYAVGTPTASAQRAHTKLYDATDAAMEIARPGVRACDLFAAMAKSMDTQNSDVGRFGHGLGMQLTEWPSLAAWDETIIRENMVLTLEPSIDVDGGGIMVTEENILITDASPILLSTRAPKELPVL